MANDRIDSPDGPEVRALDAGALRALAHPVRVQIYDILSQYGAQTASSLAEMTGESSGSTSYHLRALARHDLIREVSERGTARERWWERPVGGVSFVNLETTPSPAERAASQIVLSEFLTRRHHQLMQFVSTSLGDDLDVWSRNSLISTSTVSLTSAQLADLSEQMQTLVDGFVRRHRDQTGPDVRSVTVRADVFALPRDGR